MFGSSCLHLSKLWWRYIGIHIHRRIYLKYILLSYPISKSFHLTRIQRKKLTDRLFEHFFQTSITTINSAWLRHICKLQVDSPSSVADWSAIWLASDPIRWELHRAIINLPTYLSWNQNFQEICHTKSAFNTIVVHNLLEFIMQTFGWKSRGSAVEPQILLLHVVNPWRWSECQTGILLNYFVEKYIIYIFDFGHDKVIQNYMLTFRSSLYLFYSSRWWNRQIFMVLYE